MIFLAALVSTLTPADARPIYGSARVSDGDSLTLGDVPIRLFGIDAPELDQSCSRNGQRWPCGAEARAKLAALVDGQQVRCTAVDKDQYGRLVARCITRNVDLNQAMVEAGYAVAFRKYSSDYVDAEARAKAQRVGIWSGTFQAPQEYRAEARRQAPAVLRQAPPHRSAREPERRAEQSSGPSGACVIKGNHSRRGEWIYHVPGMPYYEQTRAEAGFCSEAAARAAGYRRAIVR